MRNLRGVGGSLVILVLLAVMVMAAIPALAASTVFEGPVPRAKCGPGGRLEPGIQGSVPAAKRISGDSQGGYRCNLEKVGQFQAQGGGWQNAWYDHCDYFDTKTGIASPPNPVGNGNGQTKPGTQVIDVSNPANPVRTVNLNTPGMNGPWESLKVNEKRGLLGAVGGFGSDGDGPMYFDVYDIRGDFKPGATCSNPQLLASCTCDVIGHEGNWAQDGKTYYGSSLFTGTVSAIDVSDPTNPLPIPYGQFAPAGGQFTHGLSTNPTGTRLYTTDWQIGMPNGLFILDVSGIQNRSVAPPVTTVGSVTWTDGSGAQHPLPITYMGKPYILFVDEGGKGVARIIDISNDTAPVIISKLKLEIHMPNSPGMASADIAAADLAANNGNGAFGYEGHYCYVDRINDPSAAACGYFQSGIRVFDIRNPYQPKEIAYYNPPAQVQKHGQLPGSEHDSASANMSTDWCTSQIRFNQAADGTWMLWAMCQDNGFQTLRFTNGVYPLAPLAPGEFGPPKVPLPNTAVGRLPTGVGVLVVAGLLGTVALRRRRRRPAGSMRIGGRR